MMLDELVNDLKRDEGWRDRPYRDTEGYLTIGYGFLIDPEKDVSLPLEVGEFWLDTLVRQRFEKLVEVMPWIEDQPQDVQRALGNMSYQLGISGLSGFSNMLTSLQAGARDKAADHALDSKWHQQTPNRAERIAALIRGAS